MYRKLRSGALEMDHLSVPNIPPAKYKLGGLDGIKYSRLAFDEVGTLKVPILRRRRMPRNGIKGYAEADETANRYARGPRKVQQSYRARKITVFVNGHDNLSGKNMTVSDSLYPTFDSFMDQLSSELGLMWAVRNIFKKGGKKISSLDELRDGEMYVAASGKYIRGDYGNNKLSDWSYSGKAGSRPAWDEQPKGKENSASLDDGYESEPVTPKGRSKSKKRGDNLQRSRSMEPESRSKRGKSKSRKNHSPAPSEDESVDYRRKGSKKGLPPKAPSKGSKASYGRR